MDRIEMLKALPRHSRGAELGVCSGDFSRHLLEQIDPELLFLVDVWQHIDLGYQDKLMGHDGVQLKRYRGVVREFVLDPRVRIIRDLSVTIADVLPPHYLDWIYIDGDHSYRGCRGDLNASLSVVKSDGIIMGHDYDAQHPGVIQAVDEFVQTHGYQVVLITNERCASYMLVRDREHCAQLRQCLNL
jgi:hypothetical protein